MVSVTNKKLGLLADAKRGNFGDAFSTAKLRLLRMTLIARVCHRRL